MQFTVADVICREDILTLFGPSVDKIVSQAIYHVDATVREMKKLPTVRDTWRDAAVKLTRLFLFPGSDPLRRLQQESVSAVDAV
jgi:hypothetical protein